ncbi:MAG: MFS transporter [Chlorobi bacterium]|nr:MFS transporter [Chlorobiota bacterium]
MNSTKKFQTGNVVTISFAHFIHDVYSSFLAPLLPLIIEKFSISLSFASFLTIIQRLPSLFNPLVGYAADKLPIRYLLIVAPAITVICMSLIGTAPHIIVLIVLLLTSGIGVSLFHVPSPVMIKKVSGDRIGKGMSFYMLGGEIARSVGPLYVLAAVSLWGLEGTYKLIPFGLIASALLFFKFRKIPISDAFKNKQKETGAIDAVKKHLAFFVSIGGIFFFTSLVKGSLTTFLPTFMTEKGETLWFGGIALSVVQFSGAAGTLFSGSISDKIGRRATLLIMGFSTPALMLLFIFTSDSMFAFPVLILIGFIMFATTPVLLAEVNSIKTEHPALINGIFMTISFLVSAFSLLLIGSLGDLLGLKTSYIITAFVSVLAIPFIFKLPS